MKQPDNHIDEDWLDKVLEQYWKQRHGMYNANQDDVGAANREAKDAIANKVVELVLEDRQKQEDFYRNKIPEKRVVDVDEPDDEVFNEAIGYNQALQDMLDNFSKAM